MTDRGSTTARSGGDRPASVGGRRRRLVDLAVVLVDRDLRISYGGAAFGLLWAPATVIVQVVVLAFVFDRVVPLDVDDYPAFLFAGVAAWHLLSSAISGSCEAFVSNRDLVRRPGFPDVVLPVVTVGRALASYALGLPLLLVVVGVSGRLGIEALALPLVLAIAALVIIGPAFVVAVLQVRHRDIVHLVRVGLGVLFYATPVFYAEERLPDRYAWIADVNPLAGVVTLHRQVLYDGSWPDPGRMASTLGFAVVGLAVAAFVYRRVAPDLADDL